MFVQKSAGNKTIVGFILTAAAVLALSACGKTETGISTAERVKLVEEKQNADNRAKTASPNAPLSAQAAPSKSSAALR